MSLHRYDRGALRRDAARGLVGLALTGGPLLAVPAAPVAAALLGGGCALFALFALRTARRSLTRVEMDADGIALSSWGPAGRVRLTWAGLAGMKLGYYAMRRREGGPGIAPAGWMQLRLRGEGGRMRLESTLEGFDAVVAGAADAARRAGLALDPMTRANLLALGIRVDETTRAPA